MAEGTSRLSEAIEDQDKECAVCLQSYVHPAQLPCGHVFCFLCIKGTANQSKRCAMCRQEIPRDFIEKPNLLKNKPIEIDDSSESSYQWFYEGRNGWWQYDERTSKELECAYKSGERTCELLIAGFLYVMDFEAWLQLRRNDPSRRRRIKRDTTTMNKKGVAGIRAVEPSTDGSQEVLSQIVQTCDDDTIGDSQGLEGDVIDTPTINDAPIQSTSDNPNLEDRGAFPAPF